MGTEILHCLAGWLCRSNEITSVTHASSHLILVAALRGRYNSHPSFIGKETKAQRGRVVFLRSHSWLGEGQGDKPRHSGSRAHVHSHSKVESVINRGQCSLFLNFPSVLPPWLASFGQVQPTKETGGSLLPELSEHSSHFLTPKSWILRSTGLSLFCPLNWMHFNISWGCRRLA